MCNACGFYCCANDDFGGCGCDCKEPECWTCTNCQGDGHLADVCPEPTEDDMCPACGGQAIRCKCTPEEVKKAVDEENAYWAALVAKQGEQA